MNNTLTMQVAFLVSFALLCYGNFLMSDKEQVERSFWHHMVMIASWLSLYGMATVRG